jgi:hypothetical protein
VQGCRVIEFGYFASYPSSSSYPSKNVTCTPWSTYHSNQYFSSKMYKSLRRHVESYMKRHATVPDCIHLSARIAGYKSLLARKLWRKVLHERGRFERSANNTRLCAFSSNTCLDNPKLHFESLTGDALLRNAWIIREPKHKDSTVTGHRRAPCGVLRYANSGEYPSAIVAMLEYDAVARHANR